MITEALSIIYFIALFFFLGYSLISLFNISFKSKSENLFMTFAFGFGAFPIIAVILNLIHIPLHWATFLFIAIIVPLYDIIRKRSLLKEYINVSFDKYTISLIVLLIVFLSVILSGAFSYPYLENDDPWHHAASALYISEQMTAYEPANFDFYYLDPYPHPFATMLGILVQISGSVYWTLKFYNVLLMTLTIGFAYIFVKQWAKKKSIALTTAAFLAVLPCFMSHFIWAQTLAILLFFPAFYAFTKLAQTKKLFSKWGFLFIISSASLFVTQPSASVAFIIFIGLWGIVRIIQHGFKETLPHIVAVIGGLILSQFFWIDMFVRYGIIGTLEGIKFSTGLLTGSVGDTSGGVIYSLMDFIIAPLASKMDQATGIGWALVLLCIIGLVFLIFTLQKQWDREFVLVSLLWIIAGIIGTMGNAFPIKLFPHRWWVFLAIGIAIFAAFAFTELLSIIKHPAFKWVVIIIVLLFVLQSSAYPKYTVQTSSWPPGGRWTSNEEIQVFSALPANLPAGTSVFIHTTGDAADNHVIGQNMYSCQWCEDIVNLRSHLLNVSFENYTATLQNNGYQFVIFSGMGLKEIAQMHDANTSVDHFNSFIQQAANSSEYALVYGSDQTFIFQLI